jgi:prepilin-type N-terminal cleavage/methylation domain-containing protein/prepilin-type processing-associated H-X9-DG protein
MREGRKGFTLVEVLVGLAIIAIASTMVVVAVDKARESAAQAECVNNLRQWGVALNLYLQDSAGSLPRRGQGVRPVEMIDRPEDWFNCLPPYLGEKPFSELALSSNAPKPNTKSIFVCPKAEDLGQPHFLAYGMNMYLSPWNRPEPQNINAVPNPASLAFLADGPGGWSSTVPSSQMYSVKARHQNRANVVFLDGHVSTFDATYLGCERGNSTQPDVRWKPMGNEVQIP